uniref:PAP-associated domain-containing protein n=1 Tax=Ditylum brightwellii TaxID=49249 RepID=A0A7S4QEU5_9STRA|mmetsp:Transcript_11845/g.15792  ORF Transcript_11845/g.15792 Transcript_11845/m.15792 type:complete len:1079 (-) Transcript_11845:165-3401(-)
MSDTFSNDAATNQSTHSNGGEMNLKEDTLIYASEESEENLLSCLSINAEGWLSAEVGTPTLSKNCQTLVELLEPWPVSPGEESCKDVNDTGSNGSEGGGSTKKADAMDWRATSPTSDIDAVSSKDNDMSAEESAKDEIEEDSVVVEEKDEGGETNEDEHIAERSTKRKINEQRTRKKKMKTGLSDTDDTETLDSEIVLNLRRVHNLHETAMRVVCEIERMGNPQRKKELDTEHEGDNNTNKKRDNQKVQRKKSKLERLAEEELAKVRKIQEDLAQHRGDDLKSEEDKIENIDDTLAVNGGDTNDIHNDDMQSEGDDNLIDPLSPRQRVEISMNSLRYVLPLLIPIVRHPQRLDANIRMKDGEELRSGKNKKKPCWILGEHVYDKCTVNAFNQLRKSVECFASLVDKMSEENGNPANCSLPPLDGCFLRRLFGNRWKCPEELRIRSLGIFLQHSFEHGSSPTIQEGGEETAQVHNDESSIACSAAEWYLTAARVCDESLVYPLVERRPHIREKNEEAIAKVHQRLTSVINTRYQDARLTIYGSCLSDLTLGGSSDVDISLHLPAAEKLKEDYHAGKIGAKKYESESKRFVYKIARAVEWNGSKRGGNCGARSFIDVQPVPRARVPVVKGKDIHAGCPFSSDGSKSFDICFMNDIAVVNSSLLREYSKIDERAKLLMLAVKCWVNSKAIGCAADAFLSSYAWMNLVIFYLQCIDFVPNLQSGELMSAHDFKPDPENHLHKVNGLKTAFLSSDDIQNKGVWVQPEELRTIPVTVLLCGFFHFYAHDFPQSMVSVSIRLGRCALLKTVFVRSRMWRLSIEDPFEIHNSHCPHDLGMHLNERGQEVIMKNLTDAADHLEGLFKSMDQNEHAIRKLVSSFSDFLPYPSNDSESTDANEGKASKAHHQPKDFKKKHGRQRQTHDHGRGKTGGETSSNRYHDNQVRGNKNKYHSNAYHKNNRSDPQYRHPGRHHGRSHPSHHYHNQKGGHPKQTRHQKQMRQEHRGNPSDQNSMDDQKNDGGNLETNDQIGDGSVAPPEYGRTRERSDGRGSGVRGGGGRGGGRHNYRRYHRSGRGDARHCGRGTR